MEEYDLSVDEIIRLRRDGDDITDPTDVEEKCTLTNEILPISRDWGRGLRTAPTEELGVLNKSLDEIITERGIKKPHCSSKFSFLEPKNHGESDLLKSLDEVIAERRIKKPQHTQKVVSHESKNPIEDQSDLSKSLDEIITERGIVKPQDGKMTTPGKDMQKNEELEQPVLVYNQGGQKPAKKIKLRKIDPCTNALEDIIEVVQDESSTSAGGRCMSLKRKLGSDESTEDSNFVARRNDEPIGQGHAPSLTPYRAVGFLSKKGMIVEMKIGRLSDDSGDRSHLWRCVVTCGAITGMADSIRKAVAREMASVQFLEQIREVYKDCHIPKYEVFEELFIDPRIIRALENEAGGRCLSISDEVRVRPMKSCDGHGNKQIHYYLFVCTYYVGTQTFKAESHLIEYAKVAAARNAFAGITGRDVPPTKYFTGAECDPSLDYTFNESESHLTVTKLEDSEQGKISNDLDEEKREVARTTLSERFKKARVDEEHRRRNMIVNVGHPSGN